MGPSKHEVNVEMHFAMQDGCINWTPVVAREDSSTEQAPLVQETVSTPADLSADDAPERFIKRSTC